MKTYTVQVEYLLPVYKTVTVKAESPHVACRIALDTGWDDGEHDYDASSAEYVTAISEGEVQLPDGEPPAQYVQERRVAVQAFCNARED